MVITWHGGSCYRVQGADRVVILDPESSPSGSRLKGDVLVRTSSAVPVALGGHEEVAGPGEYGFGSVRIKGVRLDSVSSASEVKTAYALTLDEVTVAVLGEAGSELAGEVIDGLGGADIVVAPGERASSYAKLLAAKVVVVAAEGAKRAEQDLGQHPEAQEKLSIKARDLGEGESLRLVILSA